MYPDGVMVLHVGISSGGAIGLVFGGFWCFPVGQSGLGLLLVDGPLLDERSN